MKFAKILLPIFSSTIVAVPPLVMTTNCSPEKTTLDSYSWEEIKEISQSGEASKYFSVGDTKKVQLKPQDSNNNNMIDEGEAYQTVRIIGFDQDYDKSMNRIGITFEFADKISDGSGYALATYWNDFEGENKEFTKGLNYINSSVRKALLGDLMQEDIPLNWFGYYRDEFPYLNKKFINDEDPYYQKSVMDLLPEDLRESITPAYKIVNVCSADPVWSAADTKILPPKFEQLQFVLDPLFLLSPGELGWEGADCFQEPFQHPYQYYKGVGRISTRHIKTQLKKDVSHSNPIEAEDGNFKPIEEVDFEQLAPYTFAGCFTTKENENGCWLRSPSNSTTHGHFLTDDDDLSSVRPCAWAEEDVNGNIIDFNIRSRAFGLAPAFCI